MRMLHQLRHGRQDNHHGGQDYATLWWGVVMDSKDEPKEWPVVRRLLIKEYHSELRELEAHGKLYGVAVAVASQPGTAVSVTCAVSV
jgi:hypothetical protein